jgi:hypothetical protein
LAVGLGLAQGGDARDDAVHTVWMAQSTNMRKTVLADPARVEPAHQGPYSGYFMAW